MSLTCGRAPSWPVPYGRTHPDSSTRATKPISTGWRGLLDEADAGLRRRVLPTLAAVPAAIPLVVLADHGFRESSSWGRVPRARWTHGGLSLEECVVPVAVFGPCADSVAEVW